MFPATSNRLRHYEDGDLERHGWFPMTPDEFVARYQIREGL